MNTSNFIEKSMFLISFHDTDDDIKQTNRVQSSRKTYKEIMVFVDFEGILEKKSTFVLDVFE